MKLKNNLALFLIIILSSIFIFYRFTNIPRNLSYDEVEFAKLALSLDEKSYVVYSPLATGHSTLYFYIILFSFKLFGVNTIALRLPAAIFGIFSATLFYLILNKLKIKNSFFFAIIFLTSRWFLNFSRFAFEPTFLLFLELASIFFFLRKTGLSLLISGVFAGLAFNSYTPGRIFFLLPLFFLTLDAFKTFKFYKLSYFVVPFIITIIPLTSYFLYHQDSRIDQLFFWRNHEMTLQQKVIGTFQNLSSLSLMFFTKGDMNGRHNYPGKPALNPILAGLFLYGLLISLKNYKKNFNLFFIAYFLVSLAPSIPIYPWENPSMLRTFTVLPSVVFFISNGINLIKQKIKSKYFLIIIFIILLSSLYELRTYFKYQAKVFNHSFDIKHSLEKAVKMKNPYEKNQ